MEMNLIKRLKCGSKIMFLLLGSLLLTGCGKDPLAKQMIEQIDTIGEVTLDDESLIAKLEKDYSEMTEKQKNQVSNYIELKNAREDLEQIKIDMAKEEPYNTAITLCQSLKKSLTNPNDFLLHSVEFYSTSEENTNVYKIDFSGSIGANISRLKNITILSDDVGIETYFEYDGQYKIWDMYFDESNAFYNEDNPKTELNIDIIISNLE